MPAGMDLNVSGSWKMDVMLPVSYPTRIYVRSACHGVIALAGLEDGLRVAALKHMLYERLMLKPSQSIRLVSWGRELVDNEPLSTYALQTNARVRSRLARLLCATPLPLTAHQRLRPAPARSSRCTARWSSPSRES